MRIKAICITAPLSFPVPFIYPPLNPPSLAAHSPHHSTALKWKTGFKGGEKKEIFNQYSQFRHPYSFLCFLLIVELGFYYRSSILIILLSHRITPNFSQALLSCFYHSFSLRLVIHFIFQASVGFLRSRQIDKKTYLVVCLNAQCDFVVDYRTSSGQNE